MVLYYSAAIEAMSRSYPTEAEFTEGDLGHGMDGPQVDVGRHSNRTLASFSMTRKVVLFSSHRRRNNYFTDAFFCNIIRSV